MFELSRDGDIALLLLSRPEARNAISLSGWDRIAETVAQACALGARALVLAGRGGAFCAGADVTEFARFRDDRAARTEFRLAMRRAMDAIRGAPLPVIAAIDGPCFGAGVALAMACDIRIAAAGARFAITPAKLGILYPQEDVHRLVSLVGPGNAARLLLGAGSIDGPEALRIGLVERCVDGDVVAAALQQAKLIAGNDAESIRLLKHGIGLATGGVVSDGDQDRAFDRLLGSEALAAGLDAYRARVR
jgi:enoyl-CoA hydratase/carnithine racemase